MSSRQQFYITWISDNLGRYPTRVEGSEDGALALEASSPQEAFDKFRSIYPKFHDGEGDFYVIVSNVPHPEEGKDMFIEAGVRKDGTTFFVAL